MLWNTDPRPASPLTVDKMAQSINPGNHDYPTLDIYSRNTVSPHRNVLMNLNDPPKVKQLSKQKVPVWSPA